MKNLLTFWVSERGLRWGVAAFLAGYFVMWSAEWQLALLVVLCLPAGVSVCRRTGSAGMAREPMLWLAAAFLLWNLVVGLARNPEALADYYTSGFLAGAVLLPVYLATLWLVCRQEEGARCLLKTVVWSALVAAVASIVWWYFVLRVDVPGARLRNPLVHGGLHPVGTAMTMGFAAVAAAAAYGRAPARRARMVLLGVVALLSFAVMMTLSRGALLALICVPFAFGLAFCFETLRAMVRGASMSHAIQPLVRGWPRAWPPLATMAAVALGFQFYAGVLTPVAYSKPPDGSQSAQLAMLTDSPFAEYLARGDSGRMDYYRSGISCLDRWDKYLTGAGLWGPEFKLQEITKGDFDHLHSLFVATWVHSGVIGSAMLLGLIGLGIRRAWALSHAGQPGWFALLAFGLGGLLCDGHSACSLLTHPRFENLILWFPLVGVAAGWRTLQECQAGRQPSSSESR